MPRKGFKSLTLPEDLYCELQDRAKLYGTTVQGIIKMMVFDGTFSQKVPSEPQDLGSNPSGPAIKNIRRCGLKSMKKQTLVFILFGLLVFPAINSSLEVFSLQPSGVCYEVWGGFNGDAVGNSTYIAEPYGKFVMWINDTSGSWGLSKLSRGLMPHYWGMRHAPLENELEIRNDSNWRLMLNIDLKLIQYIPYSPGNSSTNVAIVLFFDGYKTDYQEKCYQTEIQFFSYFGDSVQKNQVWYFEWRNDSVAQFKLAENLQPGEYKHYSIDLNPYIQNMMEHYGLDRVKLKHIEIFTEAYKGYCEFEVFSANISAEQVPAFHHTLELVALVGLVLMLYLLIILIRKRRRIS